GNHSRPNRCSQRGPTRCSVRCPRPSISRSALLRFFFHDTATAAISTLSLHDALPIFHLERDFPAEGNAAGDRAEAARRGGRGHGDRKSTRLNSSHLVISYAVFCLKKKNTRRSLGAAATRSRKARPGRARLYRARSARR